MQEFGNLLKMSIETQWYTVHGESEARKEGTGENITHNRTGINSDKTQDVVRPLICSVSVGMSGVRRQRDKPGEGQIQLSDLVKRRS